MKGTQMWDFSTLIEGGISIDDRGMIVFANWFDMADIRRFYIVSNHQNNFIRAFHGHKKESKYALVIKGSAIFGVVNMEEEEVSRYVLSDKKPQILYIPAGNYNGFKTLTDDTQVMFFSTSTVAESEGDDYRKPANTWDLFKVEER